MARQSAPARGGLDGNRAARSADRAAISFDNTPARQHRPLRAIAARAPPFAPLSAPDRGLSRVAATAGAFCEAVSFSKLHERGALFDPAVITLRLLRFALRYGYGLLRLLPLRYVTPPYKGRTSVTHRYVASVHRSAYSRTNPFSLRASFQSVRSALRRTPKPAVRACSFHSSVVRPFDAARKMASMVS